MTSSKSDADIWDYKASGEGETVDVVAEDPNSKPELNMEYHTSRLTKKQLRAFNELLNSWGGVINTDKVNKSYIKDYAEGRDYSWNTYYRGLYGAVPAIRNFEDLTLGERLAIIICAYEDGVASDANELDANADYPLSDRTYREAINLFPDLIEDKQPVTESELKEWIERYRQKRPSSFQNNSESNNETLSSTKNEEGYTDVQEFYLDAISDNPNNGPAKIHESKPGNLDFTSANYHEVVKRHPDELAKRIREKGTVNSEDDMRDYLTNHIDIDDVMNTDDENISEVKEQLSALENRVEELEETQDTTQSDTDIAEQILDRLSEDRLEKLLVESL